jgi:RNA polymerase sigma factor (sigma-70 family)
MDGLIFDELLHAESASASTFPSSAELRDDAGAEFDALYTSYMPLLRKIAIRKFSIPLKDADDLVQDVFASYLANQSKVRDLRPYLVGAICNASRQYHRRDEASPFLPRPEHRECGATAADELLEDVIRNHVIRMTLARLGSSCRDTLERFYLLGESAISIAEQRQKTSNYIRRLLNYCRNRVRSIYVAMTTPESSR